MSLTTEQKNVRIAESMGPKLFVIHKPIHDPFGLYRPNARGYTNNLADAWKVTEEEGKKYVSGRPADTDRVVLLPAPHPAYFTDLNAAVTLCDAMAKEGLVRLAKYAGGYWGVEINLENPPRNYKASAPTLPAAICEAYAAAKGLWK